MRTEHSIIFVTACGAVGSCALLPAHSKEEKDKLQLLCRLQRIMGRRGGNGGGGAGRAGSGKGAGKSSVLKAAFGPAHCNVWPLPNSVVAGFGDGDGFVHVPARTHIHSLSRSLVAHNHTHARARAHTHMRTHIARTHRRDATLFVSPAASQLSSRSQRPVLFTALILLL